MLPVVLEEQKQAEVGKSSGTLIRKEIRNLLKYNILLSYMEWSMVIMHETCSIFFFYLV